MNGFHGVVSGNGVKDGVDVAGTGDDVIMNVDVGVEKSGVFVGGDDVVLTDVVVIAIAGVLVGTLGTQST